MYGYMCMDIYIYMCEYECEEVYFAVRCLQVIDLAVYLIWHWQIYFGQGQISSTRGRLRCVPKKVVLTWTLDRIGTDPGPWSRCPIPFRRLSSPVEPGFVPVTRMSHVMNRDPDKHKEQTAQCVIQNAYNTWHRRLDAATEVSLFIFHVTRTAKRALRLPVTWPGRSHTLISQSRRNPDGNWLR